MRRRRRIPDTIEGRVNVTPLIDIVMCLVIFFMLVARIGVSTGADQTILVPETLLGTRIADMGNTLTLNVRAGEGDQPQVRALVNGQLKELPVMRMQGGKAEFPLLVVLTDMRKANSDVKIVIRGDKDMPYRYLEPVLSACSQANISNVNFNTRLVTTSE